MDKLFSGVRGFLVGLVQFVIWICILSIAIYMIAIVYCIVTTVLLNNGVEWVKAWPFLLRIPQLVLEAGVVIDHGQGIVPIWAYWILITLTVGHPSAWRNYGRPPHWGRYMAMVIVGILIILTSWYNLVVLCLEMPVGLFLVATGTRLLFTVCLSRMWVISKIPMGARNHKTIEDCLVAAGALRREGSRLRFSHRLVEIAFACGAWGDAIPHHELWKVTDIDDLDLVGAGTLHPDCSIDTRTALAVTAKRSRASLTGCLLLRDGCLEPKVAYQVTCSPFFRLCLRSLATRYHVADLLIDVGHSSHARRILGHSVSSGFHPDYSSYEWNWALRVADRLECPIKIPDFDMTSSSSVKQYAETTFLVLESRREGLTCSTDIVSRLAEISGKESSDVGDRIRATAELSRRHCEIEADPHSSLHLLDSLKKDVFADYLLTIRRCQAHLHLQHLEKAKKLAARAYYFLDIDDSLWDSLEVLVTCAALGLDSTRLDKVEKSFPPGAYVLRHREGLAKILASYGSVDVSKWFAPSQATQTRQQDEIQVALAVSSMAQSTSQGN